MQEKGTIGVYGKNIIIHYYDPDLGTSLLYNIKFKKNCFSFLNKLNVSILPRGQTIWIGWMAGRAVHFDAEVDFSIKKKKKKKKFKLRRLHAGLNPCPPIFVPIF